MNEIKDSLRQYGFHENEIVTYLFLLQHQDSAAYHIAKETSIPRTTVYKTMDKLQKSGFVSSWIKNGVRHFSAESPEAFKRDLKGKEEKISHVMPNLMDLFATASINPSAKLYQGKEGVKQAFEHMLDVIKSQKLKKVYVFSDFLLTEQFPKYFKAWRKRKNKTGTFTELIVPFGTPMNEDYRSDEFRETRILPESFPFIGAVDICGSTVAFFSFKDKEIYSVVIESQIIADMMTQLFGYIWQTLERKI